MSGFKNFAVVGAGDLGSFIIEELLRHVAGGSVSNVIALTRSSKGYDDLKAKGAVFKAVDYSSQTNLVAAFQDIDVVICTLGGQQLTLQIPLSNAAKEAGVKHFVLSEFGLPTIGKTDGIFGSHFWTGPFTDWFFDDHPDWAFDLPNDKVIVRGSGNVPVSWTSRLDIARYTVYVLTHVSRDQLKNRPFPMEGERRTINQILEEYQARTGKKLQITYESTEFLEKQVKEHPDDQLNGLIGLFFLELERGDGQTGTPEEVNKYWPEFNPTRVVDVILGQSSQ